MTSRALIAVLLIGACDAAVPPEPASPAAPVALAPAPPAPAARIDSDAAIADAPVAPPVPAGVNVLAPVGMAGPFPTIADACRSAKPCGFTDFDDKGVESKPATKTSCPALEHADYTDPNAVDPKHDKEVVLSHRAPGMELRIGSQRCAVPEGLRGEQDIYFMFVKRADGWWRSDALWQWSYNDKYSSGTMIVRWNDQPGRTFAGVAAGLGSLACSKQGESLATDELMVRVEPGAAKPLVWAPLVVGRRYEQGPMGGGGDLPCPTIKDAQELTETWTSADDLQLAGPATWPSLDMSAGMLNIGWRPGAGQPSAAGAYRFVRPLSAQ